MICVKTDINHSYVMAKDDAWRPPPLAGQARTIATHLFTDTTQGKKLPKNGWLRTLWHEGIMFGEIKAAVMFSSFTDETITVFIHSKIKSNGNKNKKAARYC